MSSKTKADFLAIAYRTNFICLVKLSDILERKFKDKPLETQDVEVFYIDDGYHVGKSSDEIESKFHSLTMDMDIATHRPLLATCSKTDSTLRIWNYLTRKCEMVKCLTLQRTSRPPEPVKPLSLAFHPSGYLLAGGFDSQTIVWHLLLDQLREFYVFQHYKHCARVKFSNGGQYLAIAQMVQTQKCVFVHHTYTLEKLYTIDVPSSAMVCDIVFSDDDSLISLCCTDGLLIVYDTKLQKETMRHSKRKCIYTTCSITGPDEVIAFGMDENRRGVIRHIKKDDIRESYDAADNKIMHGQFLTADCIVAGTENGLLRYFEYPGAKVYGELNMHAGPISKLLLSPNGKYAFTVGEDGVVFVYQVTTKGDKGTEDEIKGDEISSMAGVVLVEKDKIRAEQKSLEDLNARVRELENDMNTREKQFQAQWAEHSKELDNEKKKALAELEARLSSLREELSKKEQQHTEAMKKLEASHVAAVADLEFVYKAKIDREKKNYMTLEQEMKETVNSLKEELDRREKEKDKELLEEHQKYEKVLEKLNRKIQEVKDSQSKADKRFEDKLALQEDEYGKEMELREMELNKEINALNTTIKERNESINKLEAANRDLSEKNRELAHQKKALADEIEELQAQKIACQSEAEKAKHDMLSSIDEMNELKGTVINLKSKNRDGMKDKQALADVAKNLREKMSPVMDENTDLKTKIKKIEEEYSMNMKIMEKMKDTILNQESIITQLRDTDKKRELKIKQCDEYVDRIAHRLYKFKEEQQFSKTDYAKLFKELYEEYVKGDDDKFKKNPEMIGELGRQIAHLQEKKTSLERNGKLKAEQLEKQCKGLLFENAKLITELNDTRAKLQKTMQEKIAQDAILKATARGSGSVNEGMPDKKQFSMTMRNKHPMLSPSSDEGLKMKTTGKRPLTQAMRIFYIKVKC